MEIDMADIFDLFKQIGSTSASATGKPEYIIAGLGNPGAEYEKTRHNAGFLAIDRIAEKCGAKVRTSKFKALTDIIKIGDHTVLLMKPQTYMNHSGEAIKEASSFYKIAPANIIIISDDVCQAPGRMRVRKSGSAGGQRGLASIITHLGTDAFPRIRIGVGEKPSKEYDLANWVLGKFPEADLKSVSARLDDCLECVKYIMNGKTDDAMCIFNGKKD